MEPPMPDYIVPITMVGLAGLVTFVGILALARRRSATLVDYPELPPPPADDAGAGR
jgi:hypothetical protein